VLTVTVSVSALPVILIRPDESKFNVSEVESATIFVESFRLIVEKTFAVELPVIVNVSPDKDVVIPVPPATFNVSFAKSKVEVVEVSSAIVRLPLAEELMVKVSPESDVVTLSPPAIFNVSPAFKVVDVDVSSTIVKRFEPVPSASSLMVMTSPFVGAVPKVKLPEDTVKSVVGL